MPIEVSTRNLELSSVQLVDATLMRELALLALSRIRRRTAAGVDAQGAAFAPLSPAYAAQKGKAVGSMSADLQVSGRMLNELTVTHVGRNTATIGWVASGSGRMKGGTFIQRSRAVSGAEKAYYHNEAGAGRSHVIREFFALSEDDQAAIAAALDKAVRQSLELGALVADIKAG